MWRRAMATQVRHSEPIAVERRNDFVLACPDMHSIVNLSRIVRAAGCFGLTHLLCCGKGRLDAKVSRGAEAQLHIRTCRTLKHPLRRLKADGFQVVGLEQTSTSESLLSFSFPRKCVLLLGHEKKGITDELLELCDATVEIPMFGLPHSHNAATAATLAMWEYLKQHPPIETEQADARAAERAAVHDTMREVYARRGVRPLAPIGPRMKE